MECNIAIIGCGRVAHHHCKSIEQVKGMRLVAVCDLDLNKAKVCASEYGVLAFKNYFHMIRDVSNIDIVVIATPSGMHYQHAMDMLENGKHVIVEKPIFMMPKQLNDSYDFATSRNLNIYPVFQNRYNKAVSRVKDGLTNNELGSINIISVRVRWCRPQRYYDMAEWRGTLSHDGGASTNQGIHHIDVLRYLGGDVLRVVSKMNTYGVDIEAEDSLVGLVEFKSGAIGNIEITTSARPDDFEASISIVGSKGMAQIGGVAVNELQVLTPNESDCFRFSEDFMGIKGHGAVYGYGHAKIYQSVYDSLFKGNDFIVTRDDALKTIELLHSLYLSDEQGEWVDVVDGPQSNRLGRENKVITDIYRTKKN